MAVYPATMVSEPDVITLRASTENPVFVHEKGWIITDDAANAPEL